MEFQILKHKYTFVLAIVILLLAASCRKDVKVKLPEYQQKLVVEGSIETGGTAIVLLSWSVPYFGEFDFSQPEKTFVKGALVTITDGTFTDTLTEIDPSTGYIYLGSKLYGQQGKTYYLTVTVDGKSYTANSTILTPAPLDSLYFKGEEDSLGLMWQRFSEPAGYGDCYRWFAKRLGRDVFYAAPWASAFDDKFIDGKSFEFAYDRGPQPNQVQEFRDDPERGLYKRGDTVVVKLCKMGRKEYDFWNTYYQNKASNSNPFSAPANVKGTFDDSRNVFGAFVAYAPAYDTIIIPEN